MIYELRIYTIAPGKAEKLHERFKNITFDLFKKHGINVCDFWTNLEGDMIYYVCSFENSQMREDKWNKFKNDDNWIKAKKESEINGSLTDKVESILLKRADYFNINLK